MNPEARGVSRHPMSSGPWQHNELKIAETKSEWDKRPEALLVGGERRVCVSVWLRQERFSLDKCYLTHTHMYIYNIYIRICVKKERQSAGVKQSNNATKHAHTHTQNG